MQRSKKKPPIFPLWRMKIILMNREYVSNGIKVFKIIDVVGAVARHMREFLHHLHPMCL